MRAVVVHSLLAVFGLVLAYQTWTREPEQEQTPGSVTVAECRENELQKIRLETATHQVAVEPERQSEETLYWIISQRKPQPAKVSADGGIAQAPKEDPEQLKPKRFLANAGFKDYLKQLTPLRATQALGSLPADKLADFGFDKVDTKLEFTCGGKALAFEAGARTFGSGQRYVRDAKSKTAYLFDDKLVSDLQSAQFKFMQSGLHNFELGAVEEATVEMRGAKRRLLHRDRKLPDKALWVDAAAPAKLNELYGNWFSRVSRLRAREFLPSGAAPGSDLKLSGGQVTPVLRIDYKLEGKPNGRLELVRVDENNQAHYYARSETTRGWVTVLESSAKEVEQDAAMVVGLEETPPEKQQKPAGASAKPPTPTASPAHGSSGHPSLSGASHPHAP